MNNDLDEHPMADQHRPLDRARFAHIPGWGIDLPRSRRPAVPMERQPPRLDFQPHPPSQQAVLVEIQHSNERPGITPLFGSTLPPKGLSGAIRRQASQHSENDLRHWHMLLAADRVDMVEGLAGDLMRSHLPRIYAETGGRAELRHRPAAAARKAGTLLVVVGVVCWIWKRRARP
ncbi:hypothetical protein [Methyloversatilis sp.]|uniref:hypothetical protein n=1 Tax=Methyloversatilis sp. TaxID=2569862 RepID=UPI002734578D|nr:hypothetical protein [Methyloversatilis sp.]MDP2867352.1 hypothetical protein [Methyloversatilis sp.]MDP3288938.1 hypothetical protein [Methyloversatilis sp.]MDP3454656.1 hypothetical protein [Methyloversatilis sp.]MDP3579098.1 hypothetical protein [Methyloversatilis sp.]